MSSAGRTRKPLLIGLAGGAVAAVLCCCGAGIVGFVFWPAGPPVGRYTPSKLWDEFAGNQSAADAKFLGRTVEVSDLNWAVKKDGSGYFIDGGNAKCYLSSRGRDQAAKLKAGDKPVLRGVCRGRFDQDFLVRRVYGFIVLVENCEVLPPEEWGK